MTVAIRKGDATDLDAFVELLCMVRDSMPVKAWFYVDSKEEIRCQMDAGIMHMWVAVDGERIVAAFDLLVPGLRKINYGYDLGLSEKELLQVVHMDSVAVHPDYRGQGLQEKLMQTAEKWLQGKNKHILLCTVHPDNRFSLNNVQKLGYRIQKKTGIYGSVRYILRKDI